METMSTTLVGRQTERAELAAFVTDTAGRALILRGDTSVGKSALLHDAAALAEREGHRVVRAAGVEAEAGLPYAGLHQVLYPLLAEVAQLDAGTRAVLGAVLGGEVGGETGGTGETGQPVSVMGLGIAVLNLLARAAAGQPLLLALDDAQWLDDASADVYGFVGRRLAGSSVKLLAAVRADVPSHFDAAALPELSVAALPEPDAEALLDARQPGLAKRVRRLVLEQAQGNPLALLELPAQFAGRSGDGLTEELFGQPGIPLPRRLQHLYGTRIAGLSDAVRAELLKGALDGVGARSEDGTSAGARYSVRDVDEAVAAGLLDLEAGTEDFTFRHPLVRATVVQMATPNQRRAAHRVLAHVHRENLERRATHLAAATVDPDEDVADILEAAAESATRRGGALAAVAWLTRAAAWRE
ncbi:MAG: AAA family ATPase, partial [Catenulispora sp.]|nr:AAA family ATPase [Catenulispora sp.]